MTKTAADYIREAMDKQGIRDEVVRAGIPAIASAEGGLIDLKPEVGYSKTPNDRIRKIFGSRVNLPDEKINELKADDKTWFNFVYSGKFSVGAQLGNRPDTDDGYNFRGRGPIQITGRANYQRYSVKAGYPQIMDNPDLLNDPEIGAAVTIAYIVDRYKGGGFQQLLNCVGNNSPDIAARKWAAFNQFYKDGTFAVGTGIADPDAPVPEEKTRPNKGLVFRRGNNNDPRIGKIQAALDDKIQAGLVVDNDYGKATEAAVLLWQNQHPELTRDGVAGEATLDSLGLELGSREI